MYDIIIIGAGTAGISAYKEAIKHTQNILVINHGPWDTTCARVGCMPSKVLIATANRLHDAQNAADVGLKIDSQTNTTQVMQHVRQLRDRFTQATVKDVEQWNTEHKISGEAHFVNANTISVNNKQYQAKNFILAVGSTPNLQSDWKEILKERYITTDDIFELEHLPKRVAVIGSGVIAIELAQAMHRLGIETTIFARSNKVGSLSSNTLQTLAREHLSQELNILFETLPKQVRLNNNSITIEFINGNKQAQTIEVDYILSATGRSSLLNTLQLTNINSSYNDIKKLPVNLSTKQLANHPIFIAGDAFTNTPLQHEAAHEGRMLAMQCLNPNKIQNIKTLTPLGIVFSSPEMATAGQSYAQLKAQNIDFIVGFASYERQGRAITLGKNHGALEVYIERASQKLLGAELFMHQAEHLAHLLSWMIAENCNLEQILDKPYYHPTLEEGLRTALKHARRQLRTNKNN